MVKNRIGTQKENSLHAAMKDYYFRPGDNVEVEVGRYVIDIVRGQRLIEIQTANFYTLKAKIENLLQDYHVRVVHPIPQDRWILRLSKNGEVKARRKSPKHGRPEDLFDELVGLVNIVGNPHFSLEVALIQDEVIWIDDGRGSWRRKGWSVADRKLIKVIDTFLYERPLDYLSLLPRSLEGPFTNADLSKALKIRRRLAEKMTYCLRKMGLIEMVGTRQRFKLYSIVR
ncbi:MAG: hypothetical protein BMS9Abin02_1842 [Anaerolineae bacterium]|nr:MAG: hypothetical protein BMS9Abin02_1842 [Anaerolineae bacterium]